MILSLLGILLHFGSYMLFWARYVSRWFFKIFLQIFANQHLSSAFGMYRLAAKVTDIQFFRIFRLKGPEINYHFWSASQR